MSIESTIKDLVNTLPNSVELIAISKTHPSEAIQEAYNAGQRSFGENRPQELKRKWEELPKDIKWHMIGHLQTNKVRMIANFVDFIHSVDSQRVIELINSEAARVDRVINILFEIKIAQEDSKHGWNIDEFNTFVESGEWRKLKNVSIRGFMSVATYSDDQNQIEREFLTLNKLFLQHKETFGSNFDTLSMGMTSDYELAIECGSNMVRIGSLIFGNRDYNIKK